MYGFSVGIGMYGFSVGIGRRGRGGRTSALTRISGGLSERREVYPSGEIPHLWAHGLPEGKRLRSPGNVSADGRDLYSYSTIMARRLEVDGRAVYLLNPERYSVTTSGHMGSFRAAIPERVELGRHRYWDTPAVPPPPIPARGAVALNIPRQFNSGARGSRGDHSDLWEALEKRRGPMVAEFYRGEIARAAEAAAAPRIRADTRAARLAGLGAIVDEWRAVHSLFRLRGAVGSVSAPTNLDEIRERVKREAETAARQRKAAEARAVRAAAEYAARTARQSAEAERLALPDWRAGGSGTVPIPGTDGEYARIGDLSYPALRLIDEGRTVQTSRAAEVPADAARTLWARLPRLIERMSAGEGMYEPEAEVKYFRTVRATSAGLTIGCHEFPWREVYRFAEFYGWPIPAGFDPA